MNSFARPKVASIPMSPSPNRQPRLLGRLSVVLAALAVLGAACGAPPPPRVLVAGDWGKDMKPAKANVPYGPDALHRLDVYPATLGGSKGTIVFVHGGGFTGGDKAQLTEGDYGPILHQTTRGWAIVSINYRLAPKAPYPAAYYDAARAVSWVKANGASVGLNVQRVVIAGHSAGGTLAALVGTTPGARTDFGEVPRVDRWVALSPLTDLNAVHLMGRDYAADWGAVSPTQRRTGSPMTHIGPDKPAGYLVHGDNDTVVRIAQSDTLHRIGVQRGANVRMDRVDFGKGECRWHFPACGMDAKAFDDWLG